MIKAKKASDGKNARAGEPDIRQVGRGKTEGAAALKGSAYTAEPMAQP